MITPYIPPHPPATPIAPIASVIYCPVGPVQGPAHPICIPNVRSGSVLFVGVDRDPRGPSVPKCAENGPNLPSCSLFSLSYPRDRDDAPKIPTVLKIAKDTFVPQPNDPPIWTTGSGTRLVG